jgi:hypothetical protein
MSSSDTEPRVVRDDEHGESETVVTTHRSSPDKVVFTEKDNTDAWIATDQTVDVTR